MSKDEKLSPPVLFSKHLETSAYGVLRGLLGLPIEYPFDYIKTRRQAATHDTSNFTIIRETYQHSGIRGFYAGVSTNIALIVFKQSYRWPLMVSLPPLLQNYCFDNKANNYHIIEKGLTGFVIASVESLFVTPFEKYQTILMTTNKYTILHDLLKDQPYPFRSAMRDVNIVYTHQVLGWASFLMTDEMLKSIVRSQHEYKELPPKSLLWISGVVGIVNTVVSMPFERVKTLVQKDQPWPNEGVIKTMLKAYRTFGLLGLYAGFQARMIQYMLQAGLTVSLLDKLENKERAQQINKPKM